MSNVRRSLHRVPACPVQDTQHRPCRVKTAQEEGMRSEGALVLVLTGRVDLAFLHGREGNAVYRGEMCMQSSINREWIAGHVEGDGEDYWFFAMSGGKFLLAERMRARYIER